MLARISRWTLPTLILLVGLTTYRLLVSSPEAEPLPLPRTEPWRIEPRFDDPRVVTDQQLGDVLDRVRPPGPPVNTNLYVHALRLWGDQAQFDDWDGPSGAELRDYFLRDEVFRQLAGADVPPLFTLQGPSLQAVGLAARGYDDDAQFQTSGSYHQDDLLATLAETGVPLDTPLVTRQGTGCVADLLRQSLRDFHLERHEYEWTIISYARYAFPMQAWTNKYGQRIDVESLVDRLIAAPLTQGPCNGLHRMEAIVVLYRADEEAGGVLKPRTRQRLLDQMTRVSRLLVESQSDAGYWTRRWPLGAAARDETPGNGGEQAVGPAPDNSPLEANHPQAHANGSGFRNSAATVTGPTVTGPTVTGPADQGRPDLGDRLLVTGHHLEWLALAPPEVLPPRENLVRAGQWLVRTLLEIDEHDLQERYGPYSHAVRALSYWRGKQPYEAWRASRAED